VLSQAGFDAGALLQQAQSQVAKEELRQLTNEVKIEASCKVFQLRMATRYLQKLHILSLLPRENLV
jgi:hypothetical protein